MLKCEVNVENNASEDNGIREKWDLCEVNLTTGTQDTNNWEHLLLKLNFQEKFILARNSVKMIKVFRTKIATNEFPLIEIAGNVAFAPFVFAANGTFFNISYKSILIEEENLFRTVGYQTHALKYFQVRALCAIHTQKKSIINVIKIQSIIVIQMTQLFLDFYAIECRR